MTGRISPELINWIPSELIRSENEWLCRWLYAGNLPFTDPFFQETLFRCKILHENSGRYRSTGSLPSLVEWAAHLPAVPPSAFIFHVSRCGSTLVSQLLGLDPDHIVLSEAPLIDALLRLPYQAHDDKSSLPDIEASAKAAIRFYGQQRTGSERRLFIKTDSWHIFFYRQLRLWYPDIPFILLYRSPDEVLYSQRAKRGMHAIPGVIEPAVLDIHGSLPFPGDLDGYLAMVLESYLVRFLEIARTDKHTLLVNYNEGIPSITEKIALLTDTPLSPAVREQMAIRSRYHSKYPGQVFQGQTPGVPPPPFLAAAMEAYGQLEKISVRLPHYAV